MRQQAAMASPARHRTGTTVMSGRPGQRFFTRQLQLTALPSAVPWARRMVAQILRAWQLESMSDTALLLVSELITNAVTASGHGTRGDHLPPARPMISLNVRLTGTGLLLEVWDPSPVRPVRQEASLSDDCGRGLLIVSVLADNWGHRAAGAGKVVWCEIAYPG